MLASPSTVTTTGPVVAPEGTVTVIEVSSQLLAVATTPLNVTVPVPWEAPKLVPVISTDVSSGPDVGFSPLIAGVTVKDAPLLAWLSTVTATSPVVAPAGTAAVIDVSLQLVAIAAVPLKLTVLVPCEAPKLVPLTSTNVPSGPESGLNEPIAGVTVNSTPPLVSPPTVTTTSPVVAPAGTATVIEVSLQLVAVADVPLKLTVLVPCEAPKLVPLISIDVPSGPESGLNEPIAGVSVNSTPSLASPPTVTTTSPVVAPAGTAAVIDVSLQLAAVATVPLKVTVLVP